MTLRRKSNHAAREHSVNSVVSRPLRPLPHGGVACRVATLTCVGIFCWARLCMIKRCDRLRPADEGKEIRRKAAQVNTHAMPSNVERHYKLVSEQWHS